LTASGHSIRLAKKNPTENFRDPEKIFEVEKYFGPLVFFFFYFDRTHKIFVGRVPFIAKTARPKFNQDFRIEFRFVSLNCGDCDE